MFDSPKPRSVFWIVTTLVANAIAYTIGIGLLPGCIAGAFAQSIGNHPLVQAVMLTLASTVSSAAATAYACSFIRKSAIILQPRACWVPAVATFAGSTIGMLGIAVRVASASRALDAEFMVRSVGIWIGSNAAFALVSYRFYQTLTAEHARGFDVGPALRVEPVIPEEQHPESGRK